MGRSLIALLVLPLLVPVVGDGAGRPSSQGRARAGAGAGSEPPAGLSRDAWDQIRHATRESDYHAAPVVKPGVGPAFVAANRAQGYRTTFRRNGVEIVPKNLGRGSWQLGVKVTGCGYEGQLRPLHAADPRAEKQRVEYRRGPVTEWYVNGPGGLEQGFTIEEPETQGSAPIVVAMAIEGGLEARVEAGGAASFRDAAGETRVRYQGLAAWDAEAQPLATRLEASEGELRVLVEASRARFPITVDPLFVQEAKLQGHADPVTLAGAHAGYAVSVSGDWAVVGALGDDTDGVDAGSARVYVRTGTLWREQQRLVASDPAPLASFGVSVSISGQTVVVGASGHDEAGVAQAGAAYVFVRSEDTVWTEQQKLVASDAAAYDSFGTSVSVSGDTVVIGAGNDDTAGGQEAGSAYVFVRSGALWTEEQKLVASDGALGDIFGASVSLYGDTAVVGAQRHGTAAGSDAGAAYVFSRSGAVWSEQQKLVASDGGVDDAFGCSVSVSGDTLVVGALLHDTAGLPAGAAYVYVRSGAVWSEEQKLLASDGADLDLFGWRVSVSGDTALIGALYRDTVAGLNVGAAYVFTRSGTLWTEEQKLLASDGSQGDWFGAVSVSGDTALVGAYGDDDAGDVDAGSSYVFVRSGTAWSKQQKLGGPDSAAGDFFGHSVSVSGDTVVVGAVGDDGTTHGADAGSAYVFVRSGSVWSEQQKLVASDGASQDAFGTSVSLSGDTVVIGSPADDTAFPQTGSAYVFVRTGTVWSEQQKLVAPDGLGVFFGASVSASGDTAVVGRCTGAWVFVRSGSVWSAQQLLVPSDWDPGDGFGCSVSVSEDTAVVGAPDDDSGFGQDEGSAYVFVRSGSVWAEQQKLVASDAANDDAFGYSVAAAGDTVVVGAPYHGTSAGIYVGSAYVFVRSGTAWSEQQELLASDGAASDRFGNSVSASGNTTVIGAVGGSASTGSAYVFVRSGTAWSEQQELLASDGAPGDGFGISVSISGGTALVGSWLAATGDGASAGSAYVFRASTADLSVTKTDGQLSAVPGQSATYTIVAANAGPDPISGATITDALPAALTNATWTCVASPGASCTASGSGSVNDSVTLPLGATLTYSLVATIDPAAIGALDNTAAIALPAGADDPDVSNNSATDTDMLTPRADLRVSKTDGQSQALPGSTVTYTIVAANSGPSDAPGATVADAFSASITAVTWTCTPSGGASCGGGGGSGDINRVVDLPAGGAVTIVASGTVDPGATGTLVNTATVTATGAVTDPEPSDNTATDVDNLTLTGLSELAHGSSQLRSLEGAVPGGPVNLFWLRQEARSSYELVVDGVTGDIGSAAGTGPLLQRLGADATTVLQTAVAAGVGGSRSLRFENPSAVARTDEFVSVRSAGCTSTCGPEDVYRIRVWDTTLFVPRFNNSQTQITVLVLQNTTGTPVAGHAHFWNTTGTLVATQPFTVEPRAAYVVNTSTIPGLAGIGGTITLSHDGPYGLVVGKAVAVEPVTGFVFDTAAEPRRR